MSQVIAVSSGKGGVGKTSLSVNLGISLHKLGMRVCIFDADTNLANINIMLREAPPYTLNNVLDGEVSINEIIVDSHGVSFVPGASGVTDFGGLERSSQKKLLKTLRHLESQYDVILVDTAAGIHNNVLSFIEAAQQSIIVITPEPTSLTDSFSLLRMLKKRKYGKQINVVVNQGETEISARQVFKRFSGAVAKYIGYKTAYLGHVIKDELVSLSICAQSPVAVYRPNAPSSRSYDQLAMHLQSLIKRQPLKDSLSLNISKAIKLEILPEYQSSPVPGVTGRHNDEEKLHQTLEDYQRAARIRKKQMVEEHRRALLDYVDDSEYAKEEIRNTLNSLNETYQKRFREAPVDPLEMIESMLQSNSISQKKINQIFSELMLFYKDKKIIFDRDQAAEFISQQLQDFIEEFGYSPVEEHRLIDVKAVSSAVMLKPNPQKRALITKPLTEKVVTSRTREQQLYARDLLDSINFASKLKS